MSEKSESCHFKAFQRDAGIKELTVMPTKLIPAEEGTAAFKHLNSAREVSTVKEDPRFLGALPEPDGALLVFSDFSCFKWEITAYKLRDEVVKQFEQQIANVNKLCDEIVKLEAKKAACQAKVMKLVDGHTGLMVRCIRCGEHKADLNGSWQCVKRLQALHPKRKTRIKWPFSRTAVKKAQCFCIVTRCEKSAATCENGA